MIEKLLKLVQEGNIAKSLDDSELERIGKEACEGYTTDRESRKDWEDTMIEALKFSKQIIDPKNFPFKDASNVILPMISMASITFASRTYPEIVQDSKVVNIGVLGQINEEKKKKADNIQQYLTHQLLVKSDTWDIDMDKLLNILPIIGTCFKKSYYDPIKRIVNSELCNPQDIVVNHFATSLETAPRITHRYFLSNNDLISRMRSGFFLDMDLEDLEKVKYSDPQHTWDIDENRINLLEKDDVYEILEQHCFLDLDGDGYEEPYIVTINKQTQRVLSIFPRFEIEEIQLSEDDKVVHIPAKKYFTDFHFLPSPDGGFYSIGYGQLLYPLNKAANSVLNQLIDAGTLSNTKGGFIGRQLKIKGGAIKYQMGEFKPVDAGTTGRISDHIYPFDFGEPSPVLFQLLGLLLDQAREISSVNDVLTGSAKPQNAPASSVFELANQGMKVFNSIAKRLHRSLKKEFGLLYSLTGEYLNTEEYLNFHDGQASEQDWIDLEVDISPVASPDMGADLRRTSQLNALAQLAQSPIGNAMNPQGILQLILNHMKLSDEEKQMAIAQPNPNAPPPIEQQKLMLEQQKFEFDTKMQQQKQRIKELELQMKAMELDRKMDLKEAESSVKLDKARADTILDLESAKHMDRKLDIEEEKIKVQKEKSKE